MDVWSRSRSCRLKNCPRESIRHDYELWLAVGCFKSSRPHIAPLKVCPHHASAADLDGSSVPPAGQTSHDSTAQHQIYQFDGIRYFVLERSRIVVSPSWIETIHIDWRAVSSNRIFPKSREADWPRRHGLLPVARLRKDPSALCQLERPARPFCGIRLADHRPKVLGCDEILQAFATAAIGRSVRPVHQGERTSVPLRRSVAPAKAGRPVRECIEHFRYLNLGQIEI